MYRLKQGIKTFFYLSPRSVPKSIKKRRYIIFFMGIVSFVCAVHMIAQQIQSNYHFISLLIGVLMLGISFSTFYLWVELKSKKDQEKSEPKKPIG